jgi:hypothetical protein
MNRSVCKFGVVAALVCGALAVGAAPARAQVIVTGATAPAQGTTAPAQGTTAPAQPQVYVTGYYTPVQGYPATYYVSGYPVYTYSRCCTSYYYVPTYSCCYYPSYYVSYRGHCGYVSRGRGRCCW